MSETPEKFLVAGQIPSCEFQKCRLAVLKLHKCLPREYAEPDIRSMLDLEWNEYITKLRRKLGKGLWKMTKQAVVFLNGTFLGDYEALSKHILKKYRFILDDDLFKVGERHIVNYLDTKTTNYRQMVYLTVSINNKVIGAMLFMLYNDLVPIACENFLKRCTTEENGYVGTPIHRIVKGSWIQCGGFKLEEKKMRCESYAIPHDRRGILCMCNNGRHKDNTTQFFITLSPTSWMDYRYVAFGQLLQGDDVLRKIEEIPTLYQSPLRSIYIVKCGEYIARPDCHLSTTSLLEQPICKQKQMDVLEYLLSLEKTEPVVEEGAPPTENFAKVRESQKHKSLDTLLLDRKYWEGKYFLPSDMHSNQPLWHLAGYIMDVLPEDWDVCDWNEKQINDDYPDDTSDSFITI